jgi:hypothetical protein
VGGERQHQQSHREQRGAGGQRAVVKGVLQFHGQKEQRSAQTAVDQERHRVGTRELSRAEHLERNQRVPGAVFEGGETPKATDAHPQGRERSGRAPSESGALRQAEYNSQKSGADEHRPADIKGPVLAPITGLGHMSGGNG